MSDLPTIITAEGLQPQTPAELRQELVDGATALDPTLTTNLPGSLIEDLASTGTGALVVTDQARVDLVNSLTPFASNEPLTIQLGTTYGVPQGEATNGSVFMVFSSTNIGWVVPQGFIVSDGTNQFVVQEGGIIDDTNTSGPLFALASLPGTFPIPANTVTTLITSVPSGISVTVTNPEAGTPQSAEETFPSYRARVLEAGLASATGMARLLKAAVKSVPGVQPRLVSVRQTANGWEVLVGGGDPYQVADAIFDTVFDVPQLAGSIIGVTNVTQGNPAVVTTDLNHGLVNNQNNVRIADVVGMTQVNGGPYTVHVVDEKTFTLVGVNSTLFDPYVSGGVVTPNPRNIVVSINDYPDVYNVVYVNPPQQTVAIVVTWNTTAVNFVSDAAVAQLGSQAISDYVNSIPVGEAINLFEMQTVFQQAIANLIPPQLLSRLVFTVSINGIGVTPDAGTGLFEGDPESYFQMTPANVVVTRG